MHPTPSSPLNFFLFLSLLSVAVATTTSFADECYHQPPFHCGPFKNLSHPFTSELQPSQSLFPCGPPEFRLTNCDPTESPKLTIPPLSYRVLRLNQTDKTMTLARSDLWNNTCLADQFTNSTILSSTILNYTTDNEDLTIFYGCSVNFTEMPILPTNLFNCSSINEEKTSASYYLTGPVPSVKISDCHVAVTLKILQTAAFQLRSEQASLREALMEGFHVTYNSNCVSQPCPNSGYSSKWWNRSFKEDEANYYSIYQSSPDSIKDNSKELAKGIRVVIQYNNNRDCCAKDVLKYCKIFPGVSKANLDATRPLVTVIGVFEQEKLKRNLQEECNKIVEIVEKERIGGKTSKGDGGGQESIEAVKENKQAMEEEKKQTKKGKQVMEEGQAKASNGGQQGN
ncbi:hypothetical protein SO802_009093 [Lithocarpus litseifolius]|uniref:Uncharacterized protein n=1 Tax=Lithocarpus litseifolius TaxID=425828 RepID=A0AAW2DEQ9_9ROSI